MMEAVHSAISLFRESFSTTVLYTCCCKIKNKNEISQYYHLFTELPDISVYRWQDLYPSLISAFNLGKICYEAYIIFDQCYYQYQYYRTTFYVYNSKTCIDIALLLS